MCDRDVVHQNFVNKPPISELTRQPGRGILRAVIVAGARAATTGPSDLCNNGTILGAPRRHGTSTTR